jgi:hypothetical protein
MVSHSELSMSRSLSRSPVAQKSWFEVKIPDKWEEVGGISTSQEP